MATISIAGNTLSGCLGAGSFAGIGTAFSNVKKNTNSLTQSISSLKSKVSAAAQAADVSASANSTSRALSRENQKQSAVSLVYDKLDKLISNAGKVDNLASGAVEKLKQEFYRKYSYLKPECEKGLREKAADLFKGAWDGLCSIHNAIANFVCDAVEWVKENIVTILKAIAVVALLVVSIILLATGVGGILAIACIGCIVGILGSFLTNGIGNILSGKNFFEGALDAMLLGGITGAIDAVFIAIGHPYVGSLITSALKTGYDCLVLGKEFSVKDFLINTSIDLVFTGLFFGGGKLESLKDKAVKGTTKWLSNNIPSLSRLAGRGSYSSSYKMIMTKIFKGEVKHITWKTIRNGVVPKVVKKFLGGLWDIGENKFKDFVSGGLKKLFNINFDFTFMGRDLFKIANIS